MRGADRLEFDPEDCAAAGCRLESDFPAKLRSDLLGDAKPETGSSSLTLIRRIDLHEFLENPLLVVGGNPGAVVANLDAYDVARRFGAKNDFRVARRELDCV